jgi:putative ABC transport system substrate-binding protein
LLSRGIDVLWLSTDVTTTTAQAVMIKAATQAGIPVIASMPSAADDGALIALGASYYTVGFEQGQMAADILQGRDPATIPIINWTPAVLRLNLTALDRMRQAWVIPPDVRARAQTIFDANGVTNQDVPAPEAPKALGWNR